MECNKWEESGLLYVSRELDEAQQVQFKSHLSTCAFCSNELSLYSNEKSKFFSLNVLSVPTTPELDMKILSLCTAAKLTQVGILSTIWIKRVVFSALVFAFGAGAGGYFTFAYYHAKSDASVAAAKTNGMGAPVASSATSTVAASQSPSSLSLDTSKPESIHALRDKSVRATSARKASGVSQGIITVDLKKE
jgi:hypothetical protein